MNLRQINELWNEYKEKYDLPKDVQISAVQYDAEKYVEGFFNILELLDLVFIFIVTVMPVLSFSMNLLIFMIS